jgi:hypothetical protein
LINTQPIHDHKEPPIMTLDEYLAKIEAQWIEEIEAKEKGATK